MKGKTAVHRASDDLFKVFPSDSQKANTGIPSQIQAFEKTLFLPFLSPVPHLKCNHL
jgi:hypothetical protein